MIKTMDKAPIMADYDQVADVLYIVIGGGPRRTWTREQEAGLVVQFDERTNAPVGATILDFKEYWLARKRRYLIDKISELLKVSNVEAERVIGSVN